MTAKQIWMQILTEEDELAIEAGRKEWQHTIDPAYKLLDYVPPKELEKSTEALDEAVMGGEANGFCAGFYYALRMMKQIRGLHAAAEKYYQVPKQEVEEA